MTEIQAKAKLDAIEKRVLAANQRSMAAAYQRQSEHPIYPGQELICLDKANQVLNLAVQNDATADLILIKAGLEV